MTTQPTTRRSNRIATTVLLVVALLLAATTAYILIQPISPSNFESTTGMSWDVFSTTNPEVADYLSREGRLLALGWLGFSLILAAITWWPLRRGDGWASRALWLFPIALLGAALVFMTGGDVVLGGTYLVVGVVSGASLITVGRNDGSGARQR